MESILIGMNYMEVTTMLVLLPKKLVKWLPEIVSYEENGVDAIGMDYSKMTPLLVEAVNAMRREYQEQINQLKEEIDGLKKILVQHPAPEPIK